MRDRGIIYAGLLLFLGLVTFPFTYDLTGEKTSRSPVLTLPSQSKSCVASVEYMKHSHMKLLLKWRDDVVRNSVRTFTAADGTIYDESLSKTCLSRCHTNKAEFCDRCHSYLGVRQPNCMNCHIDPGLSQRSQP
jgi:hypothetical protein